MTESPERFAELLTHAIRCIKRAENNKPIRVIQDELGYGLGRDGGSAVEYWRKGNLPPGRQDVEELARLLVRRGRLDQVWLRAFLESGGCGLSAAALEVQLFGIGAGSVDVQKPHEEPPAPVPAASIPMQAPVATTHFVGRSTELDRISLLLTRAQTPRLVAVVGMGGAGKTTLAIQAAHALREHYADGVLWAHTQVSSPLDILNSWARAYGYDYSGLRDVESCAAALRSALADKQVLFVLDDVVSAAQVRPLLLGSKEAAVLLTTRSEDVAVALDCQVLALAELAPAEGVQLLSRLLGEARVVAEAAAAAQICELVHHLPLAVEIAGQLLVARPRRSLAQMAKRLQDVQYRLDLQISDRDVRTSFLVSWEALDEAHRRTFAHLALFGGRSFTVAAVAVVLEEELDNMLEQLDMLVARSLLKAVEDDRYRQHPLLADFAQEQLGDAPEAWARFAHCQLDFAHRHQMDYAALEPEWDNLMAGMATAHRLQTWALVLTYAEILTEPWFTCARYTQARQGYAWAVEAGERQKSPNFLSAQCWVKWGYACAEQNDYQEAKAYLHRGLTEANGISQQTISAEAQYHLARLAIEQGSYEEADQLLSDCYSVHEQLGNEFAIAQVFHMRAMMLHRLSQYTESNELCAKALEIQERQDYAPGKLETLRLLTDNALMEFQHVRAAAYANRALQLAQEYSNQVELAETYINLAVLYRRDKNFMQAIDYANYAVKLFTNIGRQASLANAFYEKSMSQKLMGDYQSSFETGYRSLNIFRQLQDNYNYVTCMYHLGEVYLCLGESAKAHHLWMDALSLAQSLHHHLVISLETQVRHITELS